MGNSKPHKPGFDIDIIDLSEIGGPSKKDVHEEKKEKAPTREPEQKLTKTEKEPSSVQDSDIHDASLSDSEEHKGKIIDAIFEKMKKRGNFPSFTKQIASVNKILKLKYASAKDIADVIGKDFALSQKLLRLVNSSFYGQFSKKGLTSITQAMIILGADCIQQTAASLMLFEMMQASSQTEELKNMTLGNFISGIIAKDIAQTKGFRDTETFLICSMFHSIGEYMIIFYFPEKFEKINDLIVRENMEKENASRSVLGVTYQELGLGIAGKWNLPDYIMQSMKPIPSKKPKQKISSDGMLQYISSFSNGICQATMQPEGTPGTKSLGDVVGDFQDIIEISTEEIEGVLNSVSEKIQEHANNLQINVKNSRLLKKISSQSIKSELAKRTPKPKKKVQKKINLPEKIKRLKQTLNTDYSIGDILTNILDIMHTEFNFKRVAMGIKTVDGSQIIIRYVLGDDKDNFKKNFKFKLEKTKDVFNASLMDESDTIVHDVKNKKNTDIVPKWYKSLNCAKGFSLYPIIVNRIPFGVFYVDSDSTTLNDYMQFHNEMKRLRSLAVKAIKNKSG